MEIRVLKYFLTVVREESISRAAEALHITQPAMLAEGLRQHLELVERFEAHDVPGALQVIQAHSTSSFGSDFHGRLLTPQDLLRGCPEAAER